MVIIKILNINNNNYYYKKIIKGQRKKCENVIAAVCAVFQIKRLLKGDSPKEITVVERFAAGSSAGAFAQTCIYPLEVRMYAYEIFIHQQILP